MSADTVDVAVLQLLGGRGPDADYLDIEVQCLVGQGMVAVERHHVADHRRDREYAQALVRLSLELHALANLARPLQRPLGNALHQRRVADAVALIRSERDRDRIAILLSFEGFFQARDNISMTLDVGEGLAAGGTVEHLSGVVLERVMDQYHRISRY